MEDKQVARQKRLREKKIWMGTTRRRRMKDFEALPEKIQQELLIVRKYVIARDPKACLKLVGSWPKGGWANEHTGAAIRAMRLKWKRKAGLSDLDIVIQSEYRFTRSELQPLITERLDVWMLNYKHVTGIVF